MDTLVLTHQQATHGATVKMAVKNRHGKYVAASVVIPAGRKSGSEIIVRGLPGKDGSPGDQPARIRVRNWWVWNGIAAIPGVAGLVGYAWQYVIVFAAIWGTYCYCARYDRLNNAEIVTGNFWQKFRAVLAKSAGRYLGAADIAIGIFLCLAMVVTRFRGSFSIGQLGWIHDSLSKISDFWGNWISLSAVWLLAVYLAVWVITSLLLLWHSQSREGPAAGNDRASWRYRVAKAMRQGINIHGRYSGPISVMLAILASFTFISAAVVPLGGQLHSQLDLRLSQRAEQLRAQEARNARDYQRAAQRVTADINALVISRLDSRVQAAMPSSYRKLLSVDQFQNQVDKINGEVDQLGVSVRQIDPAAARAVAVENARANRMQDVPGQLVAPDPDRPLLFAAPSTLTSRQAAAARAWTESDTNDDAVNLITESDKSVTMQMGTVLVSDPLWNHARAAVKAWFPPAEPIVDVLSGTVGDQLQESVYEKIDPIMKQIINRSGNVQQQISAAASEISRKVNVSALVRDHDAEAVNVAAERQADLSQLSSSAIRVEHEVNAKIAEERDRLVRQAVIDPIDIEASPSGGGFITKDDFGPALGGTLDSSETVQAEVMNRLVEISQLSDSELQALWQSYNLQIDPSTGYLVTNQVEGGAQITMDPATLKHNAAHVIQFLAPSLPDVISSEDLDIANANCGCS